MAASYCKSGALISRSEFNFLTTHHKFWGVAKLVRQRVLSPRSLVRVQSPQPLFRCSSAAERMTVNHHVAGSIPATGAIFLLTYRIFVLYRFRILMQGGLVGRSPSRFTWRKSRVRVPPLQPIFAPIAQLVERLTFNEDVHGSSPCGRTIQV